MQSVNYAVEGSRLLVTDEHGATHVVDFRWPIKDVVPFGRTLVIRRRAEVGASDNENVFGVNARGEIIWQIPVRPYLYASSPYTYLGRYDQESADTVVGDHDGEAVLTTNWDGRWLLLDPHTGAVLREGFTR